VEDPVLQLGLETILDGSGDCRPVGRVSALADIRAAVARLQPDVVLLDVAFRRRDETLIPQLARTGRGARVIVLVEHAYEDCALRRLVTASSGAGLSPQALALLDDCCLASLRASARGCLPRNANPDDILNAIRTVADGEIAAASWFGVMLDQSEHRRRTGGPATPTPITARELEVAALVAEGRSNKEVAGILEIREQTVKNHLTRIMRKLGLGSRLELAVFAIRHHVTLRRALGRRGSRTSAPE
jgi:DNA-binding NarL/FixJ family response regulator